MLGRETRTCQWFHVEVCLRTHWSSRSSLAELRLSGSHCSIFFISRRKHSLSCPSRLVSLSSSDLGPSSGIPAEKSPRRRMRSARKEGSGQHHLPKRDFKNICQDKTHPFLKRTCGVSSLEKGNGAAAAPLELSFRRDGLGCGRSHVLDPAQ